MDKKRCKKIMKEKSDDDQKGWRNIRETKNEIKCTKIHLRKNAERRERERD